MVDFCGNDNNFHIISSLLVSDIYVFDMEYFGQWYMFQYKNSQIIGIIQITQKFEFSRQIW